MRVLDLFAGLGGWSAAFKVRGHEVITIDLDYRFNPTYCRDIGQLESLNAFGKFDIILASPPCNTFSVLTISHYWPNKEPNFKAKLMIELTRHTIKLIQDHNPKFWVVENPVGMMRRVLGKPPISVTYCQYGLKYRKPTDLWGSIPPSFVARSCKVGAPCHVHTHRGHRDFSKGGLKDVGTPAERALIPLQLSLEMCLAAEKDIALPS